MESLHKLHQALIALDDECRKNQDIDTEIELHRRALNLLELRTFGGEEPKDLDAWSWDADNIVIGDGPWRDWHLPRNGREICVQHSS
jgi:hypothetical protein